jgi:hypothetical protein
LSVKAEQAAQFRSTVAAVARSAETIPEYDVVGDYCGAIERLRLIRPGKTAVGDLAGKLDELLRGNVSKRPNDYSGLVPVSVLTCSPSDMRLKWSTC